MSMPRLYCDLPLQGADLVSLPPGAARHVQVLRLQPGDALTLFDGRGGEYDAQVQHMGRQEVQVRVGEHHAIEREAPTVVHLVTGMPANERMDWLVEKATELGVAHIVPVLTERTVVRLAGERASKRLAHWLAIAVSACEQSGRDVLPQIGPIASLREGLNWAMQDQPQACRIRLSLAPEATPWGQLKPGHPSLCAVLGPEGGFSASEELVLQQAGWAPVSLGDSVLRTETAALTVLARWADAGLSTSRPPQ